MASNQENIEARLAAYVDGELTSAEREEIERHLAANPQHRTLIAQLQQTRAMLSDLPRAKAPADILESLQSQLERGALLGAPEELSGAETYRIGFWSQFRAIAAVLLLTGGLAAVVYYVLPRDRAVPELAVAHDAEQTGVALDDRSRTEPESLAKSAADSSRFGTNESSAAVAGKGGAFAGAAADGAPPIEAGKKDGAMRDFPSNAFAVNTPTVPPAGPDPFGPGVRSELAASGVGSNAAYIVVDTQNAAVTNGEVVNYLVYNRATWEQLPAPEAMQNQSILARMQNQATQATLVTGAMAKDGLHLKGSSAQTNELDAQRNFDVQRRDTSQSVAEQTQAGQHSQSQVAQQQPNQPSPSQQEQQIGSQVAGGFAPADSRDMDLSPQALELRQTINSGSLIVARNLSLKQVQELNDTLSRGPQRAQIVAAQEAPAPSVQVPFAGSPWQKDKPASIVLSPPATQPLVAAPGAQVEIKWTDAVLGEQQQLLDVDAAGRIAPPELGEVDVNNLTIDEINASLGRLSDQKKEKFFEAPTATKIIAPEPATQPAAVAADVIQEELAPATQPANEFVDVVIFVRDNSLPSTQPSDPATQPAISPMSVEQVAEPSAPATQPAEILPQPPADVPAPATQP